MQRWFCTQVGNFTKARAKSLPPDKKVVDLLHHVIHVGHKESTCFIKWISPTQVTTFNSRNKYSFLLLLWHNWTFELSTFPSRGQVHVPVRKAPPEPSTTPKRSSNRPPVPPDPAAKNRSQGSKDRGHEAADKGEDHNTIDYRTATHQEVLEWVNSIN